MRCAILIPSSCSTHRGEEQQAQLDEAAKKLSPVSWIAGLAANLFPSGQPDDGDGESLAGGETEKEAATAPDRASGGLTQKPRPMKPGAAAGWAPITAEAAKRLQDEAEEEERLKAAELRHREEKQEERERQIRKAKKRARSDLSAEEWRKHQFYRSDIQRTDNVVETVPREHCDTLSLEEFIEKYDKPQLPVVIDGLQRDWKAKQNWHPTQLLKHYHNVRFKVGADDDGYPVRLSLQHFMKYARDHADDDSPLYAFDSKFVDRKATRSMRDDYDIPF